MICHICGELKPVDDFYLREDNQTWRNECKECFKKAARQRDHNHCLIDPEYRKKQNIRYKFNKSKNPELYRKSERDAHKRLYENNHNYYLEYYRNYRKAHPEQTHETHKKWRVRNLDWYRCKEQRRKAAKLASPSDFTDYDWQALLYIYDERCAYCRKSNIPLHMDHVIPLSRGGTNTTDNIVPACKKCNTSKGDKLLQEWNNYD
jgi:5-methylcytosine-specific restriction endonuclease McrA